MNQFENIALAKAVNMEACIMNLKELFYEADTDQSGVIDFQVSPQMPPCHIGKFPPVKNHHCTDLH
eukprot:2187485-Amphidinium_carterae.3